MCRADFLFGTDYRFNTESNLETRYQFQGPKNFGNDRFYGLDYLQFYGEVAYNKSNVQDRSLPLAGRLRSDSNNR